MEENQVIDAPAPEVVAQEVETVTQAFTADDLAKARAQEKAKLYPQMEKMAQELEALKKAQAEEAGLKWLRTSRRKKSVDLQKVQAETQEFLKGVPQEQAQQMMQPQAIPITRGIYNAAPSPLVQPGDKVRTPMQTTSTQLQVYPNFYFRGGY